MLNANIFVFILFTLTRRLTFSLSLYLFGSRNILITFIYLVTVSAIVSNIDTNLGNLDKKRV